MMKRLRCVLRWASTIAAVVVAGATARAEEYYRGKEVDILVGYASGGGYDTYARAVAQVLGRHLPGNPSVIVRNMPGADGLAVVNYMAQRAPRDGTVIALAARNLAVAPMLGSVDPSSIRYDPGQFNWIANLNAEVSVFIFRTELGIGTLEDLRRREAVVGATGLTSSGAVYPYVANNVLGTKLKVVIGYPGTSHVTLALERGEIAGIGGLAWSSLQVQRPDWIAEKKVVPVLQMGLTRIPELDHVPFILDLARDDRERRALELVFAPEEMGRPFFAPPETAAPIVELLRKAFSATVTDPDFKAAAERARLDVTFTDGASMQSLVSRLNSASPDVVQLARQAMQRSRTVVDRINER
jgi:tripartite-type tricarboxylate transporter receptor subunit TctC